MPGHGVRQPNSFWKARRICEALLTQGFGTDILPILERREPIRKSAGADERPDPPEHYNTIAVVEKLHAVTAPVVLVDDVITRGSTLMGAYWRLLETHPSADVRAFTVARTLSHVDRIEDVKDPWVGEVRWEHERLHRTP